MSDIIINVENFKRNSKRLQKALNAQGIEASLTQAQDFMAKSLGVKNTFEMLSLLEKSDEIQNVNNHQLTFIQKLESIINSSPTIQKVFLYTDYGNFILDICSKSEESYGIYFGATNNPSIKDFTAIGLDIDTAKSLIELSELIPSDKYEGLLFGSNLFKKYCSDNNVFYFKNVLFDDEILIDNKLYHKRYTSFKRWKIKESISKRQNYVGFYLMEGHNYAGRNNIYYKDVDDIVVEYYYESHCFNRQPTCYAVKFFEVSSKDFKEISYEDI